MFVMYHICHKLGHEAHGISVVSVFVPISVFCYQTHFYPNLLYISLFEGPIRRDTGTTLFIKTDCSA